MNGVDGSMAVRMDVMHIFVKKKYWLKLACFLLRLFDYHFKDNLGKGSGSASPFFLFLLWLSFLTQPTQETNVNFCDFSRKASL